MQGLLKLEKRQQSHRLDTRSRRCASWEIDKAQADANTSLAKNSRLCPGIGGQDFEGDGLIFTSLIETIDAGNEEEIRRDIWNCGRTKKTLHFGQGGTYEQAIGGTAKAIIRHDGSSKFTDTEIEGRVS